jgi:hypothetical protein
MSISWARVFAKDGANGVMESVWDFMRGGAIDGSGMPLQGRQPSTQSRADSSQAVEAAVTVSARKKEYVCISCVIAVSHDSYVVVSPV